MAVERKTLAIVLWCVCAGVLAIVVVLFVVYCCCFHTKRKNQHARRKHYVDNDTHEQVGTMNFIQGSSPTPSRRPNKVKLFPGFTRRSEMEITSTPACGLYSLPQTVHLQCDRMLQNQNALLLVNILFTPLSQNSRVSLNTNNGQPILLGTDFFDTHYSCNQFLLYTAPLYFDQGGNYIVQAHMVYPEEKIVGVVHQFQYVIDDGGSGGGGAAAGYNNNQLIDVNLNRRLEDEMGGGQLTTYNNTTTMTPYTHRGTLSPPVIVPSDGEVMAGTKIRIEHHLLKGNTQSGYQSINLYYSTDGSPPNTLYQEPFVVSTDNLSTTARSRNIHIKAIAIATVPMNGQLSPGKVTSVSSPVAQAYLTVRPAGYSYYDPSIPSPFARVRTLNALLYFDETQNPPDTCTVYQFIYLSEARQYALYESNQASGANRNAANFLLPGKKLKFNKNKCMRYTGNPIPITEDLAQVYAWTVDANYLDSNGFDAEDDSSYKQRSGAAVYDCCYATAMQLDPSKRRASKDGSKASPLNMFLPAPVLCVSCSEVELEFEEPPAHCLVAYTLNAKEPALYDVDPPACAAPLPSLSSLRRGDSDDRVTNTPRARRDVMGDVEGLGTYIYRTNKIIKISLLSSETVHVTARVFLPVYEDANGQIHGGRGGQGGSGGTLLGYRYGDVFHRAFYFSGG